MKIVVLDSLLQQTVSSNIPTQVIPKIFEEFQRLSELEKSGRNTVEEYIKNHHGIKMRGVEKIYKYELTSGDRILYAHSVDLPWLNHRVSDSYVLLRFSKHDDQGDTAKRFDLTKERGYTYIREIVDKMTELDIDAVNSTDISMEDYVALAEILNSDDYTAWHKVFVVQDDDDYSTLSLDEMDVYLSNEQDQCISDFFAKPGPTLIIGGAGTGKTLIAVHLLINYAKNNTQKRAAYFTQSPALRKKVIALFKQYGDDVDTEPIDFNDINEYCIKKLGLKHSCVFYTREFLTFVEGTPEIIEQCRQNDLTPIVVWTEIRGIIKGGMSKDWSRTGPMNQSQFKGNITTLVKRGYFRRDKTDKKRIWLTDGTAEIEKRFKTDEELSPVDKENLRCAIRYFSSFDPSIRMLTESEYASVSEELSSVEQAKRAVVWNICKRYDVFLKENNLYDENDLVRMMFGQGISAETKYDLTVIDEVQDYSELQLFLIRALTEGNKIVFAGDEHQNTNPASFSESRLKSLFYLGKKAKLKTVRLRKNFRCQQGIIDITNALADVRRTAIGSGSAENEAPEEAIRRSDAFPNRLAYSESNLASCICELIPYPRAVFLVPDQSAKDGLLSLINQQKDSITTRIGEDKFIARLKSAVFTVAEIKGVEYEYVVCYDLIGTYIKIWQKILSGVHQQTKYRYYFNLLYVAMTRAQEYLCIVDKRLSEDLDRKMGFNLVDSFDVEQLYCNRLSASEADWYEQAQELEKNGKYREALHMYTAAKAEPICFHRCNYYIALEEKNYDLAVIYGLVLDSPSMISDYLADVKSPGLEKLAGAYACLKNNPDQYEYRRINISMLIRTCIPDELQGEAQVVLLNALRNALQTLASKVCSLEIAFPEETIATEQEQENAPDSALKKDPGSSSSKTSEPAAEEIVKSCNLCKYRKNGTCGQLKDQICSDYIPIPYVSKEEIDNWPKYGDATAIRFGLAGRY